MSEKSKVVIKIIPTKKSRLTAEFYKKFREDLISQLFERKNTPRSIPGSKRYPNMNIEGHN